jgi:HSP20 family protein
MSISRWNPWNDMISLREAMDRLLAESFVWPGGEGTSTSGGDLSVDLREEGDHFELSAPLPGVKPEDVEVTILGDTVRIHGERHEEREEREGQRWLLREQRFGAFDRTVRLPSPVKVDQAKAEFRDGMLTIALPKTEEAKERRIPIGSGSGSRRAEEIPVETHG